jgi:photosystem II CP43 chlorophyll apoprotein
LQLRKHIGITKLKSEMRCRSPHLGKDGNSGGISMTISLQRTIVADQPQLSWLVGNARTIHLSGQLLGAHIAHAGLIMFWAGITTVGEALRYQADLPFAEQDFILLPHLAALGWGLDAAGQVVDTTPYFNVGMVHLVASAVLGAGGLYHTFRAPASLQDGNKQVARFHYDWQDGAKLGLILGHHLLFLGAGALLFAWNAMNGNGLYDTALHQVRLVATPNTDPYTIFGYLVGLNHGAWTPLGLASVNNLEDVVGGHLWIGSILILGGVWHIAVAPLGWARKLLQIEAEAVLSYSLVGLALMAWISGAFVGYNTTVFPVEFYGAERFNLVMPQLFLGLLALVGHIWHAYRAKTNSIDT